MVRGLIGSAGVGLAALLMTAGCSSSPSAPSWAATLGHGVTVQAPAQAPPGHGSPGAAIEGYARQLNAKDFAGMCGYFQPSMQAQCTEGVSAITAAEKAGMPTMQNLLLGYVAVDNDKALVGYTGKSCQTTGCDKNADPAAVFATNRSSFTTLFAKEVKAGSSNAYGLIPCIEVSGKWYLYLSS
jgi:hypothetical protein